jgi:1,4-alpha-glucan branching enzyme
MHRFSRRLNHFYRKQKPLWQLDHEPDGFEWIDPHDEEQSVVTIMRKGKKTGDYLIAVCNFTPVPRHDYWIGVPEPTAYQVVFNTDRTEFGGSGLSLQRIYQAEKGSWHHRPYHLSLTLPPLSVLFLKPADQADAKEAVTDES